jgi:hypothetical protein
MILAKEFTRQKQYWTISKRDWLLLRAPQIGFPQTFTLLPYNKPGGSN